MAINRQKKEEILQELIDKFSRSKSVVFADYRGLDVASISDLRKKLREEDAEMKVAKKTLIGLAAKDHVGELDKSVMEGPVVATFSYEDPLSGIRVLFKFSKSNDKLKLLGGIVDGKVVGPDVIQQYAQLPSREELLSKLLGSLNAPLSGFVGIANSLIGGIVRVLNAYKDTKPAEGSVEASGKEEKEAAPVQEEKAEAVTEEKPAETTSGEESAESSVTEEASSTEAASEEQKEIPGSEPENDKGETA